MGLSFPTKLRERKMTCWDHLLPELVCLCVILGCKAYPDCGRSAEMKVAPGTRLCSEVKPFVGKKITTTSGCKATAACKEYGQADVNDNLKIWSTLTSLFLWK
uniref:Uncharacterized protein n=1 Tax=Micrurus surinamensis TaxID=129470 RepID=A0A2D4PNC2_MICSU